MRTSTSAAPATAANLSLTRLHLMRAGYLLMAVGLAIVKWPLLPEAHTLPLYQGVTGASSPPCHCWPSSG